MIKQELLDSYDDQVKIFRLLNHSVRIAILEILRGGEECVCHMETILGYRQAYLSQQLSVLRSAGIIQDRREGWNHFYRVVRPEIYHVLDEVNRMAGKKEIVVRARIKSEKCACPKCTPKVASI